MTFDLRIYFEGLIVMTPAGDGGMDALLVDARRPGRVPGTRGIPRHFPLLHCEDRTLRSAGIRSTAFRDDQRRKKRLLRLEDRIVGLDPATATQQTTLSVSRCAGLGAVPTTTAEAECFDWLVPILDRQGNPGRLRPGLLAANGPGPIAGAFEIRRGRLRPAGFASENLDFLVGDFIPGGTRAAAAAVVLELTVTSPAARLVARRFDGTDPRTIELAPADGGPSKVEVWVLNLEWETARYQRGLTRVPREPDREHHYYHPLLAEPPARPHLPTVAKGAYPADGVSPAFAPCSDPVMAHLFFPAALGGQLSAAAACSPVRSG